MINSLGESTFVVSFWPVSENFGSLGIGPRIARAIFDFDEDTPLPGSQRLCFNVLSLLTFG